MGERSSRTPNAFSINTLTDAKRLAATHPFPQGRLCPACVRFHEDRCSGAPQASRTVRPKAARSKSPPPPPAFSSPLQAGGGAGGAEEGSARAGGGTRVGAGRAWERAGSPAAGGGRGGGRARRPPPAGTRRGCAAGGCRGARGRLRVIAPAPEQPRLLSWGGERRPRGSAPHGRSAAARLGDGAKQGDRAGAGAGVPRPNWGLRAGCCPSLLPRACPRGWVRRARVVAEVLPCSTSRCSCRQLCCWG